LSSSHNLSSVETLLIANRERGRRTTRAISERIKVLKRIKFYIDTLDAGGILRRYFVMNGFDGALAVMGIIVGSYMTRALNPRFIVGASIGASIAMAVSGFVGAFITERAERLREIKELERSLFTSLDKSVLKQAVNMITLLAAVIDAIAPLLFALISITPFVLSMWSLLPVEIAFYSSLTIICLLLFSLGALLARISDENLLKYGLYMLTSGLAVSILGLLLGGVL